MKRKILLSVVAFLLCFTAMFTLSACGEDSTSAGSLTITTGVTGTVNFDLNESRESAFAGWTAKYASDDTDYYIERNPDKAAEKGGVYVPEKGYYIVYYDAVEETDVMTLIRQYKLVVTGFDTTTNTDTGETRTLRFTMRSASYTVKYTVGATTS